MDNKGIFVLSDIDVSEQPVFEFGTVIPVSHSREGFFMARGMLYKPDGDKLNLSLALTREMAKALEVVIDDIRTLAVEKYGR